METNRLSITEFGIICNRMLNIIAALPEEERKEILKKVQRKSNNDFRKIARKKKKAEKHSE